MKTMNITPQFDAIGFSSLREDLTSCSFSTLKRDVAAGLTVALLTIPQTMAYALVAGLPLSCGLLAAIFSAFIASFCGSSRHLVLGPSNAIAILIQAGTAEVLYTQFRGLQGMERELMALGILTQLTLMVGIFQVIGALFKLGRLTQFVSHSVIVGYLVGVVVAVATTQLFTFSGIPAPEGTQNVYEKLVFLVTHLGELQLPTLLVGGTGILFFLAIRRVNKKLPAAVIMLGALSALVFFEGQLAESGFFGLTQPALEGSGVKTVGDTGIFGGGVRFNFVLPSFNFQVLNELLPFAFAVSLLSILESTSVAKSIAARSGQRLFVNQEIFGLGIGNLVSSMIGAMPISASPSRSTFNYNLGAESRFAALFSALFVGALVWLVAPLLSAVPLAALAALILVTVAQIVDLKQLSLCLKATSSDAFVLWITILSCIFFSLDIAFYIGVALSITLYLKKAASPQLVEFDIDEEGRLCRLAHGQNHEEKKIRFIKVEGELFFGAADLFQSTLRAFAKDGQKTRVIILQLKNARDMDATACLALQQLHDYLQAAGRCLIVCGITQQVWEVLRDSGLADEIGRENLFTFDDHAPQAHSLKAWNRAKYLISSGMKYKVQPDEAAFWDEPEEFTVVPAE